MTDRVDLAPKVTSATGNIPPPLGRVTAAGLRVAGNSRTNAAAMRRFTALRRRDTRFAVLPFDRWGVLNGAALMLSAILLAMLVFDPFLSLWRSSLPGPVEDAFQIITRAGKSDWILVGTGAFLLVSFCRDAMTARRAHARHWARAAQAGYVFLAVALSGIVSVLLKYAIGRGRPRHFEEFGAYAFRIGEFDPSWASFPSGHATTAMALAAALALLFPRLRAVLLCAGLWIAFSRIATGAHYPSDLIAGCMLGGLCAWLVARGFARRRLVFAFDAAGAVVPRRRIRAAGSVPPARSG